MGSACSLHTYLPMGCNEPQSRTDRSLGSWRSCQLSEENTRSLAINEHMGEALGGGFLQAESLQCLPFAPFFTELSSFLGVPHGLNCAVVEAASIAISGPALVVPWGVVRLCVDQSAITLI